MSESGYAAARVDVAYHDPPDPSKQNPMDVLSSAGFASFGCSFLDKVSVAHICSQSYSKVPV